MSASLTTGRPPLRIRVSPKEDGYVFAIDPRDITLLQGAGASPASKIFISYDTQQDFELFHGRREMLSQVVQLLTGLGLGRLAEVTAAVDFVLARDESILTTIPTGR